jgi:ABC-type lipoprotein export system ATPase subunit
MSAVRATGVVKAFGEGRAARRVLDGAGLAVARGELVAIVGRSGSGKSTLLHVLAGLDRADAGEIVVDGERVDGASDRRLTALRARSVGFVFQFFHLVPELTGEENVLLATRVNGSRRVASRRAQELVDRLGLREVARSLPHELSGGEQQRFAIARALVNDPPVILADEPIGNLDPVSGAGVLELLRGMAHEGRAVAMVTHQPEASALADRVLRLEDGRLR